MIINFSYLFIDGVLSIFFVPLPGAQRQKRDIFFGSTIFTMLQSYSGVLYSIQLKVGGRRTFWLMCASNWKCVRAFSGYQKREKIYAYRHLGI